MKRKRKNPGKGFSIRKGSGRDLGAITESGERKKKSLVGAILVTGKRMLCRRTERAQGLNRKRGTTFLLKGGSRRKTVLLREVEKTEDTSEEKRRMVGEGGTFSKKGG